MEGTFLETAAASLLQDWGFIGILKDNPTAVKTLRLAFCNVPLVCGVPRLPRLLIYPDPEKLSVWKIPKQHHLFPFLATPGEGNGSIYDFCQPPGRLDLAPESVHIGNCLVPEDFPRFMQVMAPRRWGDESAINNPEGFEVQHRGRGAIFIDPDSGWEVGEHVLGWTARQLSLLAYLPARRLIEFYCDDGTGFRNLRPYVVWNLHGNPLALNRQTVYIPKHPSIPWNFQIKQWPSIDWHQATDELEICDIQEEWFGVGGSRTCAYLVRDTVWPAPELEWTRKTRQGTIRYRRWPRGAKYQRTTKTVLNDRQLWRKPPPDEGGFIYLEREWKKGRLKKDSRVKGPRVALTLDLQFNRGVTARRSKGGTPDRPLPDSKTFTLATVQSQLQTPNLGEGVGDWDDQSERYLDGKGSVYDRGDIRKEHEISEFGTDDVSDFWRMIGERQTVEEKLELAIEIGEAAKQDELRDQLEAESEYELPLEDVSYDAPDKTHKKPRQTRISAADRSKKLDEAMQGAAISYLGRRVLRMRLLYLKKPSEIAKRIERSQAQVSRLFNQSLAELGVKSTGKRHI